MTQPQQLLLDLKPDQPPTFDNFVSGSNGELLARLRNLAHAHNFDALTLWGSQGSGKSHLLTACATAAAARRPVLHLRGAEVGADLTPPAGSLLVIDDVDQLAADAQIALFRIFNARRSLGLALLLAATEAPLRLTLREDLRTRIGQTLIYELQALSDEEKAAALQRHAIQRGMQMDPGVVNYLLRHGRRDLPSLLAALDGLDRASLEQKRPPTVPLLKEILRTDMPPITLEAES